MRNIQTFIKDISYKPPFLFPFVAVFHVLALIYTLWSVHDVPVTDVEWLRPLWMLAYTIFWLGVCDMRRWAALSYLGLTVVNMVIIFVIRSPHDLYSSPFYLLDIIFCFFILFFYKRFE